MIDIFFEYHALPTKEKFKVNTDKHVTAVIGDISFLSRSEEYYKNHPRFKELYTDEDGDGKIDFGKKRVFHS